MNATQSESQQAACIRDAIDLALLGAEVHECRCAAERLNDPVLRESLLKAVDYKFSEINARMMGPQKGRW